MKQLKFLSWSIFGVVVILFWQAYIANYCNKNIDPVLQEKYVWMFVVCNLFLVFALLWNLPFSLRNVFRVQKFHGRFSWIVYVPALLLLDAVIIGCYLVYQNSPIPHIGSMFSQSKLLMVWVWNVLPLWWWLGLVVPLMIWILGYILISKLSNKDLKNQWRFAPDTVGEDKDGLDFKTAAKNFACSIEQINSLRDNNPPADMSVEMKFAEPVSVFALMGDLGWGKSSFARMIIEALKSEETLYSYLSLTETNEAQDLGNLFAERWAETLNARYPKLNILPHIPFMEAVLRDVGFKWLSFLLRCDKGLLMTSAQCHDLHLGYDVDVVSPNVARLFGNIDAITEKRWVFVFDEIERAEFDEIYRMIEIVERFKYVGRTGLPVPIVFILCFAEGRLKERLALHRNHDAKAELIEDFLFNDPKNSTWSIYVPLPDLGTRMRYVENVIKGAAKGVKRTVSFDLPSVEAAEVEYEDPFKTWPRNEGRSIFHARRILALESPRMVKRVLLGLEKTLNGLETKIQKSFDVRFGDLIIMEYIKIKYPSLVKLFAKLTSASVQTIASAWKTHHEFEKLKKEHKEQDENDEGILFDWIKWEIGWVVEDKDRKPIKELIGLVGHFCIDKFESRDIEVNAPRYYGSLSMPDLMSLYLSFDPEKPVTSLMINVERYRAHSVHELDFKQLPSQSLLEYSKHLLAFKENSPTMLKDILVELKERIINDNFTISDTRDSFSSMRLSAMYQFTWTLVNLIELAGNENVHIDDARNALFDILKSPVVKTETKYHAIGVFLTSKPAGQVDLRFMQAFAAIRKDHESEIPRLVQGVFDEAHQRYFNHDSVEDVYSDEENYQYVFFQSWSGDEENITEIQGIQNAAMRNLDKHDEEIRKYWELYKIPEEGPYFIDNIKGAQLYMPLDNLIQVTKHRSLTEDPSIKSILSFWEDHRTDSKYQEWFKLSKRSDTLRAVFNIQFPI